MHNPYKPSSPDYVVYRRKPTQAEIRFGHGATHYAEFPREDCLKPDGRFKKRRVVDGLVYTR